MKARRGAAVQTDLVAATADIVRSAYESLELQRELTPTETIRQLLALAFARAKAAGLPEPRVYDLVVEATEVAYGPSVDVLVDTLTAEVLASGAVPS